MEEQGDIRLHNERIQADEPGFSTPLGKITEMWLTHQGELGIKTDLAYSLGIKLTKADMDLLYQLIEIEKKK